MFEIFIVFCDLWLKNVGDLNVVGLPNVDTHFHNSCQDWYRLFLEKTQVPLGPYHIVPWMLKLDI